MGDEVEFLPADKHKSFLQDGSITLDVISQTGPKYQKQSAYNIIGISQGKHDLKLIFCLLANVEGFFFKLILSFAFAFNMPGIPKWPGISNNIPALLSHSTMSNFCQSAKWKFLGY